MPSDSPSMARSGSPPQPTVEEDAAPQRRTPLVPGQPPPHMLLVLTAQEPSATHGSNAQLPDGNPSVSLMSCVVDPPPEGGASHPPTHGAPPGTNVPQISASQMVTTSPLQSQAVSQKPVWRYGGDCSWPKTTTLQHYCRGDLTDYGGDRREHYDR